MRCTTKIIRTKVFIPQIVLSLKSDQFYVALSKYFNH